MDSESDHWDAHRKTGFYGSAGAGCIIGAASTKRLLLPFRSGDVEQPHTWGTWGGAIDRGEHPEQAVRREVQEESGTDMTILNLVPLYVFKSGSFRYYNFLALVKDEFSPRLNWETDAYRWVKFGQWPSPLHFGLQAVLNDPGSIAAMQKALQ